ncbi:MAG: protease inhibitor I42 family protein [Syntrophomonas sp.]
MKKIITWLLIMTFAFGLPVMCSGDQSLTVSGNQPMGGATLPAADDFSDIRTHWARDDIQKACRYGLMSGVGMNQAGLKMFSPDTTVNRAQLASVLQRTFNLDYGDLRFVKQPLASNYYHDVANNAWYANAAMLCAMNKIFEASANFSAGQTVSRIKIARAVQRCFTAKNINIPMIMLMPIYQDTQGLSTDEINAITFVSNTGIMKGDGQNFRPRDGVKRAELALILNRCTELLELNIEVKNKVDENYNGKSLTLKEGESFVLSLEGNPTTGYTWNLADSRDDQILSLVDQGYQSSTASKMVGQGGKNYWKFKALKAGSTEIKLNYARPWESVQPLKTFQLKVIINPAV